MRAPGRLGLLGLAGLWALSASAPAASGEAFVGPKAGRGLLEVRVTDHREAIGDFRLLVIRIPEIRLHPAGRPRREGWLSLRTTDPEVDLVQVAGGEAKTVYRGGVPAGRFNGLGLSVVVAKAELKAGGGAQIRARKNEAVAIRAAVRPGERTLITVDLVVVDFGDHPGRGYEVHVRKVETRAARERRGGGIAR
ncbi:MAG: DUF4382 domain-containing protein [Nitrospinota bacterium]